MTTKYQKSHEFIDFLEKSGYTGEIRISVEEHTFKMIDGVAPQEARLITKSRIPVRKEVQHKTLPAIIKAGDTPIENIHWARGDWWTAKVVKMLREKQLITVELVEQQSIDDLKRDAKFTDSTIRMIREGLGTMNKHLLGADIIHRK